MCLRGSSAGGLPQNETASISIIAGSGQLAGHGPSAHDQASTQRIIARRISASGWRSESQRENRAPISSQKDARRSTLRNSNPPRPAHADKCRSAHQGSRLQASAYGQCEGCQARHRSSRYWSRARSGKGTPTAVKIGRPQSLRVDKICQTPQNSRARSPRATNIAGRYSASRWKREWLQITPSAPRG